MKRSTSETSARGGDRHVLIDATIIRAVLLPATMTVLGEANWYLPPLLARVGRRRPATVLTQSSA